MQQRPFPQNALSVTKRIRKSVGRAENVQQKQGRFDSCTYKPWVLLIGRDVHVFCGDYAGSRIVNMTNALLSSFLSGCISWANN